MSRMPTLKQLKYFCALAESGHYRRAAERVGISQPSLSQQIANLEDVLQLKLVERGRSGAVLTPNGRDVLDLAKGILADVSALVDRSEIMRTGLTGTLRLGSSPTLGPYILPNVVRDLHEQFPDLRLFIRDGSPTQLVEDLLSGRHDLIMTPLPIRSGDLVIKRVFREPMRLAVARDHPLASSDRVSDAELAKERILALSPEFAHHTQLSELAREIGANLLREYEGTSLDALRQMTAMNMGVTFLPALYVRSEIAGLDGDVVLPPFRKGKFTRSIGIAWRQTAANQSVFQTFADLVKTTIRNSFGGVVTIET